MYVAVKKSKKLKKIIKTEVSAIVFEIMSSS